MGFYHHNRSPKDVTERLDRLIDEIRTKYQKDVIGKHQSEGVSGDVLVVAHGHVLRAFAMRWINQELTNGVSLLLDGIFSPLPPFSLLNSKLRAISAGGVGTLRYAESPPFSSVFTVLTKNHPATSTRSLTSQPSCNPPPHPHSR